MQFWNGSGAIQWEHLRTWDLAAGASQFSRAEGALALPGGLSSLSVFFRRQSQSASTVELNLWTGPIWYANLDTDVTQASAPQQLLKMVLAPTTGLQMTGTSAQVYGAALASGQAIGTLLFWELKNTGGVSATVVGDIHVVSNHLGVLTQPRLARVLDMGEPGGVPSIGRGTRDR